MKTLLVLGLIPGTNFTISFSEWLGMLDVLIGIYMIYRIERNQRTLSHAMNRIRQPLHASQLHPRA